jgi:predicted translin family RNA/ssDNA-binding protein
LQPLQEEAIGVLEELATTQSTMTLAQDTKDKLTIVTIHTMEEIMNKESKITTTVQTVKDSLQKFTEAWRSATQ